MYYNNNDSGLAALAAIPAIYITVAIIRNTELRWHAFFWLFWIVAIVIGFAFGLIKAFIEDKIEKNQQARYEEAARQNSNFNTNAPHINAPPAFYPPDERETEHAEKQRKARTQKRRKAVGNTDDLLSELNSLIGLSQVKTEVASLINTVKINIMREARGLKQSPMSLHLVFSGNPGTGKTTVARILGKIYRELGRFVKRPFDRNGSGGSCSRLCGADRDTDKTNYRKGKGRRPFY